MFSPYLGIRSRGGGGGGGSQGIGTQPAHLLTQKSTLLKMQSSACGQGAPGAGWTPTRPYGPFRWTLNWQVMTTHFFFVATPGNGRAPLFIYGWVGSWVTHRGHLRIVGTGLDFRCVNRLGSPLRNAFWELVWISVVGTG